MKDRKGFFASMVITLCFLIFGLLLMIFPGQIMSVVSYSLALVTFVIGLFGLYKTFIVKDDSNSSRYGLVYGVVFIILALLLVFKKDDIAKLLPYALGVIVVINSAIKLDDVVSLKKANNDNWKVSLIISLLCLGIGIVLLFNPLRSLEAMIQIVGAILIVYAVLDFIEAYVIKYNYNNNVSVEITEATVVVKDANEDDDSSSKEEKKPKKKSSTKKKPRNGSSKKENKDDKKPIE